MLLVLGPGDRMQCQWSNMDVSKTSTLYLNYLSSPSIYTHLHKSFSGVSIVSRCTGVSGFEIFILFSTETTPAPPIINEEFFPPDPPSTNWFLLLQVILTGIIWYLAYILVCISLQLTSIFFFNLRTTHSSVPGLHLSFALRNYSW